LQPIIVNDEGTYYKIIAGERRYRASRIAKLKTIPAIIKTYDDMQTLQVALIENIQRENLNPIEEALCYQKLEEMFFFRKEDIAKKVGKSRNTVGSMMSLLALPKEAQALVLEGSLSIGKARKLLQVEDTNLQLALAQKIVEEDLSIKMIDELVKNRANIEAEKDDEAPNKKAPLDKMIKSSYKAVESQLNDILGTKVLIKDKGDKGKIEIEYYSSEELDRLVEILKK